MYSPFTPPQHRVTRNQKYWRTRFATSLVATFFVTLTPLAIAQSVEDLTCQAYDADKKDDDALAAKLYEQACNGGDAFACYQLYWISPSYRGLQPCDNDSCEEERETERRQLLKQACDGGLADACSTLGLPYNDKQDYFKLEHIKIAKCRFDQGNAAYNQKDYAKAAKLYGAACDLYKGGEYRAKGCLNIGLLYEKGLGVKQSYGAARNCYQRACSDGDTSNCINLGVLYENGQGEDQSLAKARELYEKACNAGDEKGCSHLARLNDKEQHIASQDPLTIAQIAQEFEKKGDRAKAKELYGKACDGGLAEGCLNLGVLIQSNPRKANPLYEKACNGGVVEGCFNLGVAYANGRDGLQQDYTKARQLFKRACDGNLAVGCHGLAVIYAKGKGIRQDLPTAKKYFGKACDLGEQDGCDGYAVLNEKGVQ